MALSRTFSPLTSVTAVPTKLCSPSSSATTVALFLFFFYPPLFSFLPLFASVLGAAVCCLTIWYHCRALVLVSRSPQNPLIQGTSLAPVWCFVCAAFSEWIGTSFPRHKQARRDFQATCVFPTKTPETNGTTRRVSTGRCFVPLRGPPEG